MKKSALLHSGWLAATLSAFGLGYFFAHQKSVSLDSRSRLVATVPAPQFAKPSSPLRKESGASAADAKSAASAQVISAQALERLAQDAFNDPNPVVRNAAFTRLLESLTPENVLAVVDLMRRNNAEGRQWELFLYRWGSIDSQGALAHAETLEPRQKSRFLSSVLSGWASQDPAGAMDWYAKIQSDDDRERYGRSLVGGLADRDIPFATKFVLDQVAAGNRRAAGWLEMVASEEIRKNGAAGATAWGESLPDGDMKGAALDQIAGSYVRDNPEEAARWAAQFAAEPYAARVIEEVGDEWAERDPRAAISWLETLPAGAGRMEGTYSALREWTRRDPMAASQYLAALPSSEFKDSAVSGFARSLAPEDPEAAILWARTISDEGSRVRTLTRAGQEWFERDPTAAAAWLENSSLPPEARQEVLNPPRERRGRRRG